MTHHSIAFVDQSNYKVLRRKEDAPPGSLVFESAEELAATCDAFTLDNIRKAILGTNIGRSSSKLEAAEKLWYVLALGSTAADVDLINFKRSKDKLGNFKFQTTGEIELVKLDYVPGADSMKDFFFKKLPKQARQILQMLIDDGREVWTGDGANQVVLRRADELDTVQGAMAVFTYYKSSYFANGLLRRVSYKEFLRSPEFSGLLLEELKETT